MDLAPKGKLFTYPFGTRVGLTLKEILGEFTLRDKHTRSISNASILPRWSKLSCWRASWRWLQEARLESVGSMQTREAAPHFKITTPIIFLKRAMFYLTHQSCSKASFTLCCSSLLALSITFTSLCSSSSTGSLTTSMARRLSRSVRHSMATSKDKFFAWRARSAASFTWREKLAG